MKSLILFVALAMLLSGCSSVPKEFVEAVDAYDKAAWQYTERGLKSTTKERREAIVSLHNAHRAMIDEQLRILNGEHTSDTGSKDSQTGE